MIDEPKYTIAFKFQSEKAETTIINYTFSQSQKNELVPTIRVQPVFVGKNIVESSGSNMDNVLRHGLVPGTKCYVYNANDAGVSIGPCDE